VTAEPLHDHTELARIEASLRPDRLPTRLDSSAAWLLEHGVPVEAPPEGLPGRFFETGYLLPDDLPIEEWLRIGKSLQQHENAISWWLGDWWNYGKGWTVGGKLRRPYGEMRSQGAKDHVEDTTGHAYDTIRRASQAAQAFTFGRRRPNLPFSHHIELAPLIKEATRAQLAPEVIVARTEQMLDQVERDGTSVLALRDLVREERAEIKAAQRAALPVPQRAAPGVLLAVADGTQLPLLDEVVDLVITSPPYALDKDYDGGDIAEKQWRRFMLGLLRELYRVAKPSGRLFLNIPLDTTKNGFRPTYAQAVAAAHLAGWTYRSTVVWHDDQLGKSTARGSFDQGRGVGTASAPHIIAPVEMILIASKGGWWRPEPDDRLSDIQQPDWLTWTNGYWTFPGESNAWEDHPAPFPLELPRRALHLLSFPDDLVLDPCLGSGTTAKAARDAGRRFVGFDLSPAYVRSSARRVK